MAPETLDSSIFAPRRGASSDFQEKGAKMQGQNTVRPPPAGWGVGFEGGKTDLRISSWAPPAALLDFFLAPEAPKSDLGRVLGSILREPGRQERNQGSLERFWSEK